MIPRVQDVQYMEKYTVKLTFVDQKSGEIDLSSYIWGEAFEPLRDVEYFAKVQLEPEIGTICWPNGIDIAPESLYEKIIG